MKKSIILLLTILLIPFFFVMTTIHANASEDITYTNAGGYHFIVDDAGILTEKEESLLYKQISEFRKEHNTDLYIIIEDDMMSQDVTEYTHNMGVRMKVGNAVMIYVHMEYDYPNQRGIEVRSFKNDSQGSTKAYDNLTTERCINLYKKVKTYFSNANYYDGFSKFITYTSNIIETDPINDKWFAKSYIQLLIAIAIAIFIVFIMAANSGGKMTANQSTYLDISTSQVLRSSDDYVRSTTIRTKRPSSTGGGSGGGGFSGGGSSSRGGGGGF